MRPSIEDIIVAASEVTPYSYGEIIGTLRFRSLVRIRQAVCFLAKREGHSYAATGRKLGGRDHSTAIHGAETCANMMMRDPRYLDTVARIYDHAVDLSEARREGCRLAVERLAA